MTDNKLHTNLDEWLAQFPEPETPPQAPPDLSPAEKAAARYFGFDPDALTIIYDENEMPAALLDSGVLVSFGLGAGSNPYTATVNGQYQNMAFTPQDLAERIYHQLQVNELVRRNEEIEAHKAKDHANRARVKQVQVTVGDIKDNAYINQLMNSDGWEIHTVFTWLDEPANQLYQLYTLTHD